MATTGTARQQLDAIAEIADESVRHARLEGFFAYYELRRARHHEGLAALATDERWAYAWEGEGMQELRARWAGAHAEHAQDCRDRAAGHLAHLERDARFEDEIEGLLR